MQWVTTPRAHPPVRHVQAIWEVRGEHSCYASYTCSLRLAHSMRVVHSSHTARCSSTMLDTHTTGGVRRGAMSHPVHTISSIAHTTPATA